MLRKRQKRHKAMAHFCQATNHDEHCDINYRIVQCACTVICDNGREVDLYQVCEWEMRTIT